MPKHSVLIVDDSPISRKILRSCLSQQADLDIAEATGGEAGLAHHREHQPHITFLDLTMPGMNGLDCLERIKAATPGAVVVVVTADVQRQSVSRALALGALEVVPKPPTRDAVAAVLARAIAQLQEAGRGA